jgi:hypothetical protein
MIRRLRGFFLVYCNGQEFFGIYLTQRRKAAKRKLRVFAPLRDKSCFD